MAVAGGGQRSSTQSLHAVARLSLDCGDPETDALWRGNFRSVLPFNKLWEAQPSAATVETSSQHGGSQELRSMQLLGFVTTDERFAVVTTASPFCQ